MNRAGLYSFLFEKLIERGSSVLSVRDLAAMAEVEKVVALLSADSDAVLAAVTLAVLLPETEREDVATKFGPEAGEIFTQLRGGVGALIGNRPVAQATAARLVAESSSQETVAAAAAFLAVEAATTDGDERSALRQLLETAVQRLGGPIKEIIDALIVKCRETPPAQEHGPVGPLWIVSFSIDVAASTEAKTRMRALAADDAQLGSLYQLFYRQFLHKEDRFYRRLLERGSNHTRPLDWRKLFVVKGIGDELWLFYQVQRGALDELRTAMARILDAALGLSSDTILWSSPERETGPAFDPEIERQQRRDSMRLPFKIYLDLISDGYEISKLRANYMSQNINAYLNLASDARFGQDHMQIANRLNAGYLEIAGRRLRSAYRTDYIGHEIDTFFRTTKGALPAVVTIGESLFEKLAAESRPIAFPGVFRAQLSHKPDPPNEATSSRNDILYAKGVLKPDEMKGIGYPYLTYYLLTLPHLRALHYGNIADAKVLEPTICQFPREVVDAMSPVADREPRGLSPNERS